MSPPEPLPDTTTPSGSPLPGPTEADQASSAEALQPAVQPATRSVDQRVTGEGNQAIGQNDGTAIATVAGDVHIYAADDKPKAIGIPHNLPRSGAKKFVGRDLEELHRQLRQADSLAITALRGMGGIGKTELALQYAHHHLQQETYPGGMCWLRAREQELGTQIVGFARSTLGLSLPDDLELSQQVAYCWRHWPAGEVLVVLDDVKDYAAIKAFLPPPNPRFWVLLTTRLQLGSSLRSFELEVLGEAASLELLASLMGADRVEVEPATAKALCYVTGWAIYP